MAGVGKPPMWKQSLLHSKRLPNKIALCPSNTFVISPPSIIHDSLVWLQRCTVQEAKATLAWCYHNHICTRLFPWPCYGCSLHMKPLWPIMQGTPLMLLSHSLESQLHRQHAPEDFVKTLTNGIYEGVFQMSHECLVMFTVFWTSIRVSKTHSSEHV